MTGAEVRGVSAPIGSREPYLVLLLAFVTFLALLPRDGHGDLRSWGVWAAHLQQFPVAEIYGDRQWVANYPPLWLYVLALFGRMFPSPGAAEANVHLLKIVPLTFDILSVALVMRFLFRHGVPPQRAYFILFNVAFLYNTLVWGQVDSIHTFFVLASLLAVLEHRPVRSILCLVLAANVKLQTITFVPFLALLNARELLRASRHMVGVVVASAAALQIAIVMPFVVAGTLLQLWAM